MFFSSSDSSVISASVQGSGSDLGSGWRKNLELFCIIGVLLSPEASFCVLSDGGSGFVDDPPQSQRLV